MNQTLRNKLDREVRDLDNLLGDAKNYVEALGQIVEEAYDEGYNEGYEQAKAEYQEV